MDWKNADLHWQVRIYANCRTCGCSLQLFSVHCSFGYVYIMSIEGTSYCKTNTLEDFAVSWLTTLVLKTHPQFLPFLTTIWQCAAGVGSAVSVSCSMINGVPQWTSLRPTCCMYLLVLCKNRIFSWIVVYGLNRTYLPIVYTSFNLRSVEFHDSATATIRDKLPRIRDWLLMHNQL